MSRENFNSLIKDVVDNLDNADYKTTVNNRRYDLKNTFTGNNYQKNSKN